MVQSRRCDQGSPVPQARACRISAKTKAGRFPNQWKLRGPVPAGGRSLVYRSCTDFAFAYLTISSARSTSPVAVCSLGGGRLLLFPWQTSLNHACKLSQLPGTVFRHLHVFQMLSESLLGNTITHFRKPKPRGLFFLVALTAHSETLRLTYVCVYVYGRCGLFFHISHLCVCVWVFMCTFGTSLVV